MASAASNLSAVTSDGNARFNHEAASWDTNPFVNTASELASKALLSRFPALSSSQPTLDILELGCGTGLLTLRLAPFARHVTAIDAAQGMIDVLGSKLQQQQQSSPPQNVTPLAFLLESAEDERLPPADGEAGDAPRRKYDLIVSHLVLHHIPELKPVLATLLACLKPGGQVALTDFEDFGPTARRFHPLAKMDGVQRHGIRKETMEALMREVGFEEVQVVTAWTMEKRVERWEGEFGQAPKAGEEVGEIMDFPFVVCLGRRGGG